MEDELDIELTKCKARYRQLLSMLKDWITVQEKIKSSHRIFKFPFEELTRVEGQMAALEHLSGETELMTFQERRYWTDIVDKAGSWLIEEEDGWKGASVYLTLSFPSEVAADVVIKAAKLDVTNEGKENGAYRVTILDFIKAEKPTKVPGLLLDLVIKLDSAARCHRGTLETLYFG